MAGSRSSVSVIMIFLNEERYLEEAIASVYAQSHRDWELLLLDDGSTDDSAGIAKRYAAQDPSRVRYLEHPEHQNRGMAATRNLGLRSARGELVAFLDADDVWLPDRLERGAALLDEHGAAAMVYGRTRYWHSWNASSPEADWVQPHGFRAERLLEPPQLLVMHLLNEAALPCMGSITVRREQALEVGFVDAFRGLHEDQAFVAQLCLNFPVYVTEECWDLYRQHAYSACAQATLRGETLAANEAYLSWLGGYLERERMRGTQVWDAYRFACRSARGPRGWYGRLTRAGWRTATRVAMSIHAARPARQRLDGRRHGSD